MTRTPSAGAQMASPDAFGAVLHSRVQRERRGFYSRATRYIGRMSVIGSTAFLTSFAVASSVFLNWAIGLTGFIDFKLNMLVTAVIVTVLTAMPMCYMVMLNLREISASRRTLSRMTEKLALAFHNAEQANEAKSRFLANMSHELRTPLNAVIGFSDIMLNQRFGPIDNPRYVDYAKDINSSGVHLLGIINDILDLAKIESGETTIENETHFDVLTAIEVSCTMLRPLAARQNVSLSIDVPDFVVTLHAVERMVRQVLINILSNAVKYTPPEGTVHLSFERRTNGAFAILVQDTGIGMTPDEMKIAMSPFGQVSSRLSGTHTGTGLGLPLAKAMMEMHGGSLVMRSQSDLGTSVALTFPATRIFYEQPKKSDELPVSRAS